MSDEFDRYGLMDDEPDTIFMRIQRNLIKLTECEDFDEVFRLSNSIGGDIKIIAAQRLAVVGRNSIGSAFDVSMLRDAFVQGMGGQ